MHGDVMDGRESAVLAVSEEIDFSSFRTGDVVVFRLRGKELTGVLVRDPILFDIVRVRVSPRFTVSIPKEHLVLVKVARDDVYVRKTPKVSVTLHWYGRYALLNEETWRIIDTATGNALSLPKWAADIAEEHSIAITYTGRVGGVKDLKRQAQLVVDKAVEILSWPFGSE